MLLKKTRLPEQSRIPRWAYATAILCLTLFLAPHPVKSEESPKNKLPSPPDTGSPEEDFSAGGTRDNRQFTEVCGEHYTAVRRQGLRSLRENRQEIVYLLGNKNREYTASKYPTFWFYLSNNVNNISQIDFLLKEVETGKKIYNRTLKMPERAGTVGIAIPSESRYALSSNKNYHWSLTVDCGEPNQDSVIVLEGWLLRQPTNSDIRQRIAAAGANRYKVYLEQGLLYDALNELAQRRIAEPNNPQLATAWNQLLVELGWQELIQQSAVEPCILKPQMYVRNK